MSDTSKQSEKPKTRKAPSKKAYAPMSPHVSPEFVKEHVNLLVMRGRIAEDAGIDYITAYIERATGIAFSDVAKTLAPVPSAAVEPVNVDGFYEALQWYRGYVAPVHASLSSRVRGLLDTLASLRKMESEGAKTRLLHAAFRGMRIHPISAKGYDVTPEIDAASKQYARIVPLKTEFEYGGNVHKRAVGNGICMMNAAGVEIAAVWLMSQIERTKQAIAVREDNAAKKKVQVLENKADTDSASPAPPPPADYVPPAKLESPLEAKLRNRKGSKVVKDADHS